MLFYLIGAMIISSASSGMTWEPIISSNQNIVVSGRSGAGGGFVNQTNALYVICGSGSKGSPFSFFLNCTN
jgi:hypothetical protein